MRLFRPSLTGSCFYPDALFRIKTTEMELCLTFDDGPNHETSPRLVELLKTYNVKSIFFCSGRSAELNPDLINLFKSEGHILGNHGYGHLDGWKTATDPYIADVEKAAVYTSSSLFRPPYGHLTLRQYRKLKSKYKIVFWDLMPYDFDKSLGVADSSTILLSKLRPGSVVVLHDNPDSILLPVLAEIIEVIIQRGYRFVLPF